MLQIEKEAHQGSGYYADNPLPRNTVAACCATGRENPQIKPGILPAIVSCPINSNMTKFYQNERLGGKGMVPIRAEEVRGLGELDASGLAKFEQQIPSA
jgi:hypothetical protein